MGSRAGGGGWGVGVVVIVWWPFPLFKECNGAPSRYAESGGFGSSVGSERGRFERLGLGSVVDGSFLLALTGEGRLDVTITCFGRA